MGTFARGNKIQIYTGYGFDTFSIHCFIMMVLTGIWMKSLFLFYCMIILQSSIVMLQEGAGIADDQEEFEEILSDSIIISTSDSVQQE